MIKIHKLETKNKEIAIIKMANVYFANTKYKTIIDFEIQNFRLSFAFFVEREWHTYYHSAAKK